MIATGLLNLAGSAPIKKKRKREALGAIASVPPFPSIVIVLLMGGNAFGPNHQLLGVVKVYVQPAFKLIVSAPLSVFAKLIAATRSLAAHVVTLMLVLPGRAKSIMARGATLAAAVDNRVAGLVSSMAMSKIETRFEKFRQEIKALLLVETSPHPAFPHQREELFPSPCRGEGWGEGEFILLVP